MCSVLLCLLLLLAPAAVPAAQQRSGPPISQEELLLLVRSKGLFSEPQVLEIVESRGIGFRLTKSVRKTLKKEGASAALLAAVEKAAEELKQRSGGARPAAEPQPGPKPPPLDGQERTRLLEQVRRNALEYTNGLPNFICVQVTKRMVELDGRGYWVTQDVIQSRLTYYERRESYKLVTINAQLTNRSYESLGGAISTGEFGSLLHNLFLPETQTHFAWVGPASLRGRPVYEYDYSVAKDRSHWHITWNNERTIIPPYRGRVTVDAERHQVLRLSIEAEEFPADFPIRAASTTLDYDYATIAGRSFLLPVLAVMEMNEGRIATRNEIQFRQYRRYTADTKIDFKDIPP